MKHPWNRRRIAWMGLTAAAGVFWLAAGPIRQDESYHLFADTRTMLGVPHFWNVISNLGFLPAGLWGLAALRGSAERVMAAGLVLTAAGSAYYHLAPDDARLVWDRLPMTLVFMAVLALLVWGNREDGRARGALAASLAAGLASVGWWSATGDLRAYGIVKAAPVILCLGYQPPPRSRRWLWTAAVLFAVSTIVESFDRALFRASGGIGWSGHTWKHLVASVAAACLVKWRMVERDGRKE